MIQNTLTNLIISADEKLFGFPALIAHLLQASSNPLSYSRFVHTGWKCRISEVYSFRCITNNENADHSYLPRFQTVNTTER